MCLNALNLPELHMNRAYSFLETKAVNEDERTITGWATTPQVDRVGDVVEPLGVQYKNPLPLLWQHEHDKPIGLVEFGKPTAKGVPFTATLPRIEEEGKLKDRIEEAWQSIKAGLVRAVSIGFRSLDSEPIKGTYGIRYKSTEVYELSAVTIPANASAVIQTVKSFDVGLPAASGKKETPVVRLAKPAGASATAVKSPKPVPKPQEGPDMNYLDQIKSFKETRAQQVAAMESIQQKAMDEGRSKDAAEQEEFDTAADQIKAIDREIKDLEAMEALNVAKAQPVPDISRQRERVPAIAKNTEKLEPGILFARYAMCKMASQGNPAMAAELAKSHYPQHESIVKSLELEARGQKMQGLMKATVEAGTTLDTTWAAPLVDYQNFAGDFVEFLRPRTILGQFGNNGVPSLNRIPFNVRIAGQTTGGQAYWVGEGAPKPLTSFDFTATELRWNKIATIAVLTNELIRFSNPSAERLVRDGLAAAVIERADIDFIDPAKTAVANVSPASITNGATAIPSSGSTADDVRADIQALWAPFIAARNAPRNAVYIMDSSTALALSLMQNPLGQSEFPGLTMNGGTFMGVPVVVSDYLPVSSAGGIVVLVNASDIWLADDGQVTIDSSREASLQMLDNPTNNSATGTPTSMVSMFQTNSTAFLAERYINWARRRASGVAYLTGVNWGQ
jgi:HK97 family phage major capsid protein/HK97 family phage prohead protease